MGAAPVPLAVGLAELLAVGLAELLAVGLAELLAVGLAELSVHRCPAGVGVPRSDGPARVSAAAAAYGSGRGR